MLAKAHHMCVFLVHTVVTPLQVLNTVIILFPINMVDLIVFIKPGILNESKSNQAMNRDTFKCLVVVIDSYRLISFFVIYWL